MSNNQTSSPMRPCEEDYDNLHHAFGRPRSPDADCYRNYFATGKDGDLAQRFEALGWWDFGRSDGSMAFYHVNGAGKQALAEWMAGHTYDGRWNARTEPTQ